MTQISWKRSHFDASPQIVSPYPKSPQTRELGLSAAVVHSFLLGLTHADLAAVKVAQLADAGIREQVARAWAELDALLGRTS